MNRPEHFQHCIKHCQRCDFRTDKIVNNWAHNCTVDGRDILTAATSGRCPLRLYEQPLPTKPRDRKGRYTALFREGIKLLPPAPKYAGRGICVVGMGRYFPSAYVTIRVLRHLGYQGKIELWALDQNEIYDWAVAALETLNVRIVNAQKVLEEFPAVIRHPWALKPYAILHSGYSFGENWKDCLYLDADAYPVRSDFLQLFESPEYKQTGAIYFPDDKGYDLKPEQWAAFGLPPRDEPGFESGEIYIDKERNHRELHTALLLCEHHDYTFGVVHGDKETFHIAHRLLGSNYSQPSKRWVGFPDLPCMLQHDFAGEVLFVHRSVSKFSLSETTGEEYFKSTGQVGDKRNDKIPLEAFCWEALEDLRKLRSKYVSVVQLEAAGDLLVLLPGLKHLAKEHIVSLVVADRYAPLVEGHDWLNVIRFNGKAQEWKKALLVAEAGGEVRLSQVGHVPNARNHESWAFDIWTRAGVPLELYDSLPLELDNRNPQAEQCLIDRYCEGDKPLILLNTIGNSSPYGNGDALRQALNKTFGDSCQILDLAFVKAARFIDLLGLYDRACLLISTDTGTLHLGNAIKIPTIALVRDPDEQGIWGQSPVRSHWVETMTYGESKATDKVIAAVKGIIDLGDDPEPDTIVQTTIPDKPKEKDCGCSRKKNISSRER